MIDIQDNLPTPGFQGFPFNTFGFTATILAVYLLTVLKVGRMIMEHRKPFKLKTFMVIYNIYQLVACVYVIKTQLEDKELPPSAYFSKCTKAVSFLKHPHLYNFTSVVYWLKASEMLETIVFVLRKKHNQISFLHVFHHCATITMSYLGGYSGHVRAAYLAICINSFVHIVMYSYYLAAAVLSDEIVAKLTPIKKSITTLQMVQFTIILIHVLINRFFHGCRYNDLYVSIFCTFVAIIYYNFYVFYKKTYTNKESKVVKNGVNKSVTKGH